MQAGLSNRAPPRPARPIQQESRQDHASRYSAQIVRPPSTSRTTPVRNSASSEQRNNAEAAISDGLEKRPSGIVARNLARISGESVPRKVGSKGVSPATGASPFTLMRSGASSTAIDLVSRFTAPFDPL